MSFNIKSLSTQGLPRLPFDLRVLISKNEGKVRNALNRAARLNGLGYNANSPSSMTNLLATRLNGIIPTSRKTRSAPGYGIAAQSAYR